MAGEAPPLGGDSMAESPITGRLLLGSLLLLAAGLHLAAEFVLSWFAGINVGDSLTHYIPRSVRFLQYGTFGIHATHYDFMQYFHQTVVAVQLLFLRSDVLVNPFSFLAASMTSVAIYALARSLGWPRPYPLFAALTPLAMPILLLHAVTSNFDTFIALWIVLSLYFLRRGFALSASGWLLAAATATALAFATKPTAWFVMPGLGLVWLVTLGRAVVRRRLRRRHPDVRRLRRDLRARRDAVPAAKRDLARIYRRAARVAELPAWGADRRADWAAASAPGYSGSTRWHLGCS